MHSWPGRNLGEGIRISQEYPTCSWRLRVFLLFIWMLGEFQFQMKEPKKLTNFQIRQLPSLGGPLTVTKKNYRSHTATVVKNVSKRWKKKKILAGYVNFTTVPCESVKKKCCTMALIFLGWRARNLRAIAWALCYAYAFVCIYITNKQTSTHTSRVCSYFDSD